MCGFRLVNSTRQNVISRGLSIFGSFCKLLRNVVTEIFVEPYENWEVSSNRILTGTISRPSCFFMCAKLVIQYLMCGFRLVSSTCQNVISRGLPIFGSFCKLLRNIVTETFVEPSENWEVSSNRILTGGPPRSFINVKLVIHYFDVRFLTCQFYLIKCEVQKLPIFRKFCKRLGNFVTKTFQSCSQQVPIMEGVLTFSNL